MKRYLEIAKQFAIEGEAVQIFPLGNGNINDTYAVNTTTKRYVLQKINTFVFEHPKTIMRNMQTITTHISKQIALHDYKWKTQHPIHTQAEKCLFESQEDGCWRMISFIEEAESIDAIDSLSRAFEVGRGLGSFHKILGNLPSDSLSYVLPKFHRLGHYLDIYDQACTPAQVPAEGSHDALIKRFIQKNRAMAMSLERAREEGKLPLGIMHGDPKINNIMFDKKSGKAISMIDLDTVQPGLLLYDLGDCARSSCNPFGEEEQDRWQEVYFDHIVFEHLWEGFMGEMGEMLDSEAHHYAYDAIFAITFEMLLRFFTDYLHGDTYFKIAYPKNNLYRALVQCRLAQSILDQEETIRKITAARS